MDAQAKKQWHTALVVWPRSLIIKVRDESSSAIQAPEAWGRMPMGRLPLGSQRSPWAGRRRHTQRLWIMLRGQSCWLSLPNSMPRMPGGCPCRRMHQKRANSSQLYRSSWGISRHPSGMAFVPAAPEERTRKARNHCENYSARSLAERASCGRSCFGRSLAPRSVRGGDGRPACFAAICLDANGYLGHLSPNT